ncbi:MAG: glycosyltransferase family 2 protein [Bacteroidia bacterium]|nr:glycosyltransferase family 2 protein [Bacteroidia bacterium]
MKLSIIICTYNRDKFIADALNSLAAQSLNKQEYEVIVVNNNCTDNTENICRKFATAHPELNFRHDTEKTQGLSSARNKGISISTGKFIAFIDDDAITEKTYAENIVIAFEKYPEYHAIGGKVLPIYPDRHEPVWMSKYIQGVVSKVDLGEEFSEFKKKYPVGCNMAFRKEIFEELGEFNTELLLRNDDKYIFLKLKRNNKRTLYAPNVVVHHNIDAYRMEYSFIKKLSKQIGSTERVRLKTEPFYLTIAKPFEYLFKFCAALILGFRFMINGQFAKAVYIVMIRWLVLVGFFGKVKYY